MTEHEKTTPAWWRHLTPEELEFAQKYIEKRNCTAAMRAKYNRIYYRARRRAERAKKESK